MLAVIGAIQSGEGSEAANYQGVWRVKNIYRPTMRVLILNICPQSEHLEPAQEIHHEELGNLSIGSPADIAVLNLRDGNFGYYARVKPINLPGPLRRGSRVRARAHDKPTRRYLFKKKGISKRQRHLYHNAL